jgi:hypothetical protein
MLRSTSRVLYAIVFLLLVGAVYAPPTFAQDACTACHTDRQLLAGLTGDSARAITLAVDPEEFAESIHGRMQFTCTLCHSDITDYPHEPPAPVDCGMCHSDARDHLATNVHGRTHEVAGEPPATCADCHTNHHILGPEDPASSVYRLTQFEGCASCHSDSTAMARFGHENVASVRSYLTSVHGRGLIAKGLAMAPVCTDCHSSDGAHDIELVTSTESPVHHENVGKKCGQCHVGILAQYERGIHGAMFLEGNRDVPTCIDCHLEHGVQPITSEASSVYPTHIAQTCTACHDREDLDDKYGLPPGRGRTFLGSFHGIALESGELTVANCESCHGAHDILPSSDTLSTIHPANLVETCGSCHPGIGAGVANGKIHVRSLREDVNFVAYAVQLFYIALIAAIVLYAAGMIFLDQYRRRVVDSAGGSAHD